MFFSPYSKVGVVQEVLGVVAQINLPPPSVEGTDSWIILNFVLNPQPHPSLWCWAAVTAAVVGYYEGLGKVCQCEVVNKVLMKTKCCRHINKPPCEVASSKIPGGCNKEGSLRKALDQFQHLVGVDEYRPLFNLIRQEIKPSTGRGRIVGFREKKAHFVVVDGFHKDFEVVHVRDPYDGSRVEAIYNSWKVTHAYFTR